MDRAAAAVLAGSMYSDLRGALGITGTDEAAGIAPVLDAAFVRMGVSVTNLAAAAVPSADDLALYHHLRLYTLDRCLEKCATLVDTEAGDPAVSKKYSQMTTQIKGLRDGVAGEIAALGLDDTQGGEYGNILCNWQETSRD